MSTRSAQKMATIKAVVAEDRWNASPAQRGFGLSMLWRRLAVTLRAGPAILLWLMLAGCAQAAPSTPATQVAPPAAWTPPALQSGQETYPIGSPVLTDALGRSSCTGATMATAAAARGQALRDYHARHGSGFPQAQPLAPDAGYRIESGCGRLRRRADFPVNTGKTATAPPTFPIILAQLGGWAGCGAAVGQRFGQRVRRGLLLPDRGSLSWRTQGDVFPLRAVPLSCCMRDSVHLDGGDRLAHETVKVNQSAAYLHRAQRHPRQRATMPWTL
jgi:hypothetical protein